MLGREVSGYISILLSPTRSKDLGLVLWRFHRSTMNSQFIIEDTMKWGDRDKENVNCMLCGRGGELIQQLLGT